MQLLRKAPVALGLITTLFSILGTGTSHGQSLRDQFTTPPMLARPRAFWPWLNGNAERERILYDLQQMKEKGMGGAEVWDVAAVRNPEMIPGGPEFLSPPSAELIRYAFQEGKKLGLRMGMITSSGWNAGGTWVTPDWASKMLVVSSTVTTGGLTDPIKLPFPQIPEGCPTGPDGLPKFRLEVATLAIPETGDKVVSQSQVINLSDKLQSDGTLAWTPPPGVWRILRFVCTNNGQVLIVPSPNSNGLFIDFLDPEATRKHLKIILDKLQITPENAREVGLDYLEVDSMELHEGNPWTDKFGSWFQDNFHYDLTNWLPALAGYTVNNKGATKAFLYDYHKAVSDLLIHSHYETGSEFLKPYGIDFVGESGGPGPPIWNTCPVDALKALGNVTIPRGEFWIQHRNMFLIKEVASAAHIYGKPIVDAESFTTWRRYLDSPFELKKSADRAFTEGLNQLTIHTFAHSPESAGLPGRHYHAGIDINPNSTWWPFARPFMDYLSRCSTMLRQGLPRADVLWYYGDQAPNFFPKFHDVPEKPRLPGLGRGYEFDVVNSDVILNRLTVENGSFTLPEGTAYKILAFPDTAAIPLEVLTKLSEFVNAGGVLLGNPPKATPGLHNRRKQNQAARTMAQTLWGDSPSTGVRTVGKGRVYYGLTLDDVLAQEKINPDFQVEQPASATDFDFIHRTSGSSDIYFIRNNTDKQQSIQALFRVKDLIPENWDPATGKAIKLPAEPVEDGRTRCSLQLDPGGATFVVFSTDSSSESADGTTSLTTIPVSTPWFVNFPPGHGIAPTLEMESLRPLNTSEWDGIRYFSGVADYHTTIPLAVKTVQPGKRYFLDFGTIADLAQVTVNGHDAGITWKPPYQVEVTGMLEPGLNSITARVANLWHNRMVGDATVTPGRRITRSNLPLPKPDDALTTSGLLGPVNLIIR